LVPEGEVTMLLGRNGAGKTTTLRTIMGLWHASRARIRFDGRGHHPAGHARHRLPGIAYVPENMGIFTDLTVRRTCCWPRARRATRARWTSAAGVDLRPLPGAEEVLAHPAGKLSGGQKQMLAVARAIVEPRAAADRRAEQGPGAGHHPEPDRRLRELKASGVTILLVEQNFNFAKRLGDTVAVMDNGRVVHSGAMAELAADEELQQRCWGCRWERTNDAIRACRRLDPRFAAGAGAEGRDFDWLPIAAAGAVLALLALPLVGSFPDLAHADRGRPGDGHDHLHVIASGLTLVFGLMDVLNFGHGVFIALGAFMATTVLGGHGRLDAARATRSGATWCVFAGHAGGDGGGRRGRLGLRARHRAAGVRPAPQADPDHHGRHDRRRGD
jgi:branched-chain amino acid transport system ATP-binding protein